MDYNVINFSELTVPLPKIASKHSQYFRELDYGINVRLPNDLNLCIRWMNLQDIATVCNIERQVFNFPWPAEGFLYELENRDYNISLVGLLNQLMATYSVSYIVCDELHISNVAVVPQFRRLKIGETMLRLVLRIGLEKKCHLVHLEVRKNNVAAIALYQKYGFQVVGVRKNYYQNDNEDALLMTKKFTGEKLYGMV